MFWVTLIVTVICLTIYFMHVEYLEYEIKRKELEKEDEY